MTRWNVPRSIQIVVSTVWVVLAFAAAATAQSSPWPRVAELAPGAKVQVELYDRAIVSGRAVRVTADAIAIATKEGERSVARTDIRRVRVPSPAKRVLYGAIGITAGILTPVLVCPSCANEGHSIGGAQAMGAGLGSLAFLIPATSTIYKGPER